MKIGSFPPFDAGNNEESAAYDLNITCQRKSKSWAATRLDFSRRY